MSEVTTSKSNPKMTEAEFKAYLKKTSDAVKQHIEDREAGKVIDDRCGEGKRRCANPSMYKIAFDEVTENLRKLYDDYQNLLGKEPLNVPMGGRRRRKSSKNRASKRRSTRRRR